MTLKEWTSSDSEARKKFESECYRLGMPRLIGVLAEEAAKALADALTTNPQVTAVVAGEDNVARRSILMVTTSLRMGEKLSGVPDEFSGFPVAQYGVADKKEEYLRRLEFVLRAANVPESETKDIMKRFDEELSNVGSAYYAETPGRWIAEAVIAGVVKGELTGRPRVELRGEIWAAVTDFFEEADPVQIGFDAQQAARLRAVLQACFANHGVRI